jgi:hypothetical protein
MELMEDTCYWCKTRITRPSKNLRWVCDYESADCDLHPVAILHREISIHQTAQEVAQILRADFYIKEAQRKRTPLRAVGDNVVMISNKAQRTSRSPAEKILPKTGSIRRSVYESIKHKGDWGYTDYELEAFLQSSHQTVSASRRSLVIDGFLIDSGRTRKNTLGNECIVWVIANQFTNGMLFADV